MAAPRLQKNLANLKNDPRARLRLDRTGEKRRLHLESLEDRRLMAIGPSLVAVVPNNDDFLQTGDIFNTAPREITFRFAQGNVIDANSLATGFIVKRAGADHAPNTSDDVTVTPGFLGLGDTTREVIMRFGGNLPDDAYRITLVGAGATPLKDTSGNPFNDGVDRTITFTLDLGTKISAIVPQPITRGANNVLSQDGRKIEVYFDQTQQLTAVDVIKPSYYRLIDASTGVITLPQSVAYDNGVVSKQAKATLTFAAAIPAGTFKLEIGTTTEPTSLETTTTAQHIGGSMATSVQAFIGDSLLLAGAAAQANDVDLYKFDVHAPVTDFAVTVTPAAGSALDALVRIFDKDGVEIQAIDLNGGGGEEVASNVTLATAGTYYVGVSSAANANYIANSGAGATGGTTTGAYAIKVDFSDTAVNSFEGGVVTVATDTSPIEITSAGHGLINGNLVKITGVGGNTAANNTNANPYWTVTVIDQDRFSLNQSTGNGTYVSGGIWTNDNSSFATGTVLGVVGSSGKTVPGQIGPSFDPSQQYTIQFPGAGDAPGERNIPFQGHITTVPGRLPDPSSGVETITYNFQTVYGFTPEGEQFSNVISNSESQKQRVREALELYSRYLGVQFLEVDSTTSRIQSVDDLADMTIATGDPHAVAPTISGGTGNTQDGINAIAGVASVVKTADATGLRTTVTGNITGATNPTFTSATNPNPIIVTSAGHGLTTGAIVEITGTQGQTGANGVWRIIVLDQDRFSLTDSESTGPYVSGGTWTLLNMSHGVAIMNALVDWGASPYGGAYFQTAMNEIGHLIGLGDNFEAPALTIMGGGQTPAQATNTGEPVFPGDPDIVYGQTVHRPEGNDIDVYQFTVSEPGLFRSETIAERLPDGSLLNTVLTLYQQTSATTRTQIARNDDYYGNDSYLEVQLGAGTYYVAVTSVGNSEFDPTILGSGFGGRTQGDYELTMSLKPDAGTSSLRDISSVALDGDGDGNPGGTYQFWFQSNTAANTIYVDTTAPTNPVGALGSITNPYIAGKLNANLGTALAAAGQSATQKIVRIVGNPGSATTLSDDKVYQLGYRDPNRLQPLADGGEFLVPQNVTVMIDAGAAFKMRRTNMNAGTTSQGLVSRSGGAIQVLGTPSSPVLFTSFGDDTVGGDSDGPSSPPLGGDYGGIVYRDDSDRERPRDVALTLGSAGTFTLSFNNVAGTTTLTNANTTTAVDVLAHLNSIPALNGKVAVTGGDGGPFDIRFTGNLFGINPNSLGFTAGAAAGATLDTAASDRPGVFLNYVNHAKMTYGGGKVRVDSVEEVYDPIHLSTARPTLSYNNIQKSARAGISADPNTFDDDGLQFTIAFDNRRIGPDIHDNFIVDNALNGLFVRVRTVSGSPIDFVDVPTRWDDSDIVYVVSENLQIAGTPGGSISPGSDRTTTTMTDGRLRIDPGVVIKLSRSRIETLISSQFIAEGTESEPIIFTSLKDDKFGGSGTFDTNRDGSLAPPSPGDWGGLVFGPASSGSIAQASILYGGGAATVAGGFDNFNAIEIHQADVRVANSLLQLNDAGGGASSLGAQGTIFVLGAQSIIVGNVIRDNSGPVATINANSMTSQVVGDYGQSTGRLNAVPNISDNHGPLIRANRFTNNRLNGMEIRGGTLTTETVWDDTDIAHILRGEIVVLNHQVFSGLRLQSTPAASLVVKLSGVNAGFTANGMPLDINDRIGGTVQLLGQPGFPVVLTSISDDSVSAGFSPDGLPMFDIDNSGGKFLTGPEVNSATLIDNDVLTRSVGHFEMQPNAGGEFGTTVPSSNSGITAQGKSALFTNQNFIEQFLNYIDIGAGTGAIRLSASTITTPPALISPDRVQSKGSFTGSNNNLINWTVDTSFANGSTTATSVVTFAVATVPQQANQQLGTIRFVNYFDQANITPTVANNDLLLQTGTPGQVPLPPVPGQPAPPPVLPGADFRLATINNTERIGFSQGGVYATGAGLTNATFDGWAADTFANLQAAITAGTATYDFDGNINIANLPAIVDPALGIVNGLGNVTTAMSWTVTPTASTATITTFLQLIPQNPSSVGSPGDWRGVKLEQFSNDRNVAQVIEGETGYIGTNADISLVDHTRSPQNAQFLGGLAPNQKSGDETRRLGFQVDGAIAFDNPADVDVYSFNGDSDTEVWIDIDRTSYGLDAMVELVDTDGNMIARATDVAPDVTDIHNPNVPLDAGLAGTAVSFNKDPYNGRDTYSTNGGATRLSTSATGGLIESSSIDPTNDPGATSGSPIVINSANHGLATGDRVLISGITGIEGANGVFTIRVTDQNHFALNESIGIGTYGGGGTWTKLVSTTRDPIMRITLPRGANGQLLKNVPFFIRVRSQPASLAGEAGNTLNPGLTSGQYQLQVRLQQKDEKPGSTIRFADLRYATNAIEIHGLPFHSPLTGETAETPENANSNNDTFAVAQNLGNLLRVDRNTLSVGGQLSSATDVDWYRFDLSFDLLQFVNGYTDGQRTWSTIFDIDYGDGLSRADTTLSVFDQQGRLVLIGRDSNVQDDQGQTTTNLANGTFGKKDAFIGPAQLPAVVPGQQRTYFVAVSSDRMMPSVLDQQFLAAPTDANVRMQPVESVARVADDPLETFTRSVHTGNGTAEFADSQYIDPDTINQGFHQASSTLVDPKSTQSLQANVRPFKLGDVQMFVTNGADLFTVDPTVPLAYASNKTSFQTDAIISQGFAEGQTDFGTQSAVTATFTAKTAGTNGNNIRLIFSKTDNNGFGPTFTVINQGAFTDIFVDLDTDAGNIAGGLSTSGTTADQLVTAMNNDLAVSAVILAVVTGGVGGTDITSPTLPAPQTYSPVFFSGGLNTPGALNMVIAASFVGAQGNNIVVNFTRANRNGQGVLISVSGTTVNITLDTTHNGFTGTTAQQLVNAIQFDPQARALITATIVQGSALVDIANPVPAPANPNFSLRLSGGDSGIGAVEGQYAPNTNLTTANNTTVNDLAFRNDGVLYGYEGIFANNNSTSGQLILVDTGVGNAATAGTDAIPDDPAQPVTPPTIQSIQTITSNGGDAFAWGGNQLNNGVSTNNTFLFYAVAEPGSGASRLYRANPVTGSAAFTQGQPWGRVGNLITAATSATGSTDFTLPATEPPPANPVTISFRTIRIGTQANNGIIRFLATHNNPGRVVVTINNTLPADLTVEMNLDITSATNTRTFTQSGGASTDMKFDAGPQRQGAQGNNITITFTKVNGDAPPDGSGGFQRTNATFSGPNNDQINVPLYSGVTNGHIGTTAQDVADAINFHPINQALGIILVSPGGQPDVNISGTQITSFSLAGGSDPSTAAQVVAAINAALQPGGLPNPGQVIQATLSSGSGNTIVALDNPPGSGQPRVYADVLLNGATGTPGETTGMAFANDEFTLYGVTNEGQFLRAISLGNGVPAASIPVSLPDPFNPGSSLTGPNLRFAGMTLGPQNVENGRFANMFFAITDNGILTALNTNGEPQKIFDTDNDGVEDSTAILTGANQLGFVTGLAFSPFDFNLWHPTYRRQNDPGHDMGEPSGLATSRSATLDFPSSGRQQDSINQSFYFGWEPWHNPNIAADSISSYPVYFGSQEGLGTGNASATGSLGQYGLVDPVNIPGNSSQRQRELSVNAQFNTPSYNVPVGAYGSLITDKFSLGSMTATDKPTFYFDYFLDTEDSNQSSLAGNGEQRDSARVYIGPFTRFDSTGGPFVTGSVQDPTATATTTKFNGIAAAPALSGVDGFYTGKALRFTSGPLIGQVHIITNYVGATRTFTFQDAFTAVPGNGDTFNIAYGYETWDLLATNNSTLDSQFSTNREGELPTFLSTSVTGLPANGRQQGQLLHDNTTNWRQSRVDLSRYAGQTGLQLRFDFSTAGQMPDSKGHLKAWQQNLNLAGAPVNTRGAYPPTTVVAAPGQDYLYEDGFGQMARIDTRQDNNHEGFYIDNIIIGPAERGEMVINAPVNTNFTDLSTAGSVTQPRNYDPLNAVPTQVLAGPYQLEIRRAAEYGLSDGGPLNTPNISHNTQTPILLLDTNDRLIPDERLGPAIPLEGFETGAFTSHKWGFNDDANWIISTTANTGSFSAASGPITNGESSGLSISLITGGGNLTFARRTDSEAATAGKRGDVLRLFIDGRLATFTAIDGVTLASPRLAQWSGSLGFETITVPVSAGHHNFRWSYEKDASDVDANGDPAVIGQDRVFIDDVKFPTPQIGVQNIYQDPSLHNSGDGNAVTTPIGPTVPAPTSFAQVHFIDTLYPGFTRGGDQNVDRQQGHIQIEMNQIYAAQQAGILIDAEGRDAAGNPYPGGVRNLPTLNTERLVPGVTVTNNVISGSQVGIRYSGSSNAPVQGQAFPLAPVPFGRIVNNTIFGFATPTGTGIVVSNNSGPTILNNIVANTSTGISVDQTSAATTVLGSNLYANNSIVNTQGVTAGTGAIFLTASDPLFLDAANRNFYLAPGAQAVNSAQDALPDRPTLLAVKSAVGISRSDILAPDYDLYGQFRLGEGSSSPGGGENIAKDRGAIEQADTLRPEGVVYVTDSQDVNITDNDSSARDRNAAINDMAIRNTNIRQFVVRLTDIAGVGIADLTVENSQFTITLEDGTLLYDQITAVASGKEADYRFTYNEATDEAFFEPSAGFWELNHTYTITLNNAPVGAVDDLGNPLPVGILDLAGNQLAANRADGTTSFNVFVGTLYDFGDAPDPNYPTLLINNGAVHVVEDGYRLGASVTEESEAFQSATANGDSGDDGVVIGNLSPNTANNNVINTITVNAVIPAGKEGRLDAWIDINRDGDWSDTGEKLSFDGNPTGTLVNGPNTLKFNFGGPTTAKGLTFARFRFSSTGSNSATGEAPDGEVEDYRVSISGPPFQNNNSGTNALDVNNNAKVSPADALTVINYLNSGFNGAALVLGQPPIPDPAGGGPGQGLYVDVNGDTFLSPADAIAVINYLNGQSNTGGEGEGESSADVDEATAAFAMSTSSAPETLIPPELFVSPNIVVEVRDRSPQAALVTDQVLATPDDDSEDLLLLALNAAKSTADDPSLASHSKLKMTAGWLDESIDEASWEELIGSLASDQENK